MNFALAWIGMGIAILAFVWEVVDAKEFRRRLDRLESDAGSERLKRIDLDYEARGVKAIAHQSSRESFEATQAIDALYDHLGLELREEPHRLMVLKRKQPESQPVT